MIGIRTLLCAASAACGLTLGLNVQAAKVTLDMPACNSFGFDGTNITCITSGGTQVAPTCSINGPTTAATGSTVTLQANCPGATAWTWGSNYQCTNGNNSSSTCKVTSTNAGAVSGLTVTGTNAVGTGSPSAPFSVTFSDAPPPDTGGIPTTCNGIKVVSTTINAFDGQAVSLPLGSGDSQIGIFKVIVPAGAGPNVNFSQLRSGGTTDMRGLVAYVSKTACDMPNLNTRPGTYASQQWGFGMSSYNLSGLIDGSSNIERGSLGDVVHMAPGDVWYLMFKNIDTSGRSSCKSGTCAVIIKPNTLR